MPRALRGCWRRLFRRLNWVKLLLYCSIFLSRSLSLSLSPSHYLILSCLITDFSVKASWQFWGFVPSAVSIWVFRRLWRSALALHPTLAPERYAPVCPWNTASSTQSSFSRTDSIEWNKEIVQTVLQILNSFYIHLHIYTFASGVWWHYKLVDSTGTIIRVFLKNILALFKNIMGFKNLGFKSNLKLEITFILENKEIWWKNDYAVDTYWWNTVWACNYIYFFK